jgi:acetyl esterase/lipase
MARSPYHPELRRVRFLPSIPMNRTTVRLMRGIKMKGSDPGPDVTVEDITVSPDVSIRLFRPVGVGSPVPAMLWMHGGGHLFGAPEQDDRTNIRFARELGIVVAAARYRLGSDAPAPASIEDCHAALLALVSRASEWGIDPAHIAIGGASAGGGVTAGLALYAHDAGGFEPAFQLLVYPMLDDRTVARTDADTRLVRGWTPRANRFGWATYTAGEPGRPGVSPYAAPARREDLTGLPPAWIGVGSVDLFHDEDVAYARRLIEAGVPCDLFIVPGATHGFDQMFAKTDVARDFWQHQADALRGAGIASI